MSETTTIECDGREWRVTLSDPLGHSSSLAGNLPDPNERALRFESDTERYVMRVGLSETLSGLEDLCELLRELRDRTLAED